MNSAFHYLDSHATIEDELLKDDENCINKVFLENHNINKNYCT